MKASGAEIEEILPHRAPFLFVDSAEVGEDGGITARHLFRPDEFFFAGHFPGYPVVPGVILIETLAQAGGVGVNLRTGLRGIYLLDTVNKCQVQAPVGPVRSSKMQVTTLRGSPKIIKQSGKGFVGGELAVEAEWLCIAGSEDDFK